MDRLPDTLGIQDRKGTTRRGLDGEPGEDVMYWFQLDLDTGYRETYT